MSRLVRWIALALAAISLAACERPPMQTQQIGYRGLAMEQVSNPRIDRKIRAENESPEALPAVPPGGPPVSQIYKNVQVLGDLSVGEFTRLMAAITAWVSPQQSCAYCHVGADFADDSLYTKVVSRRMIQMTRHINTDWGKHVGDTGVTCYTCHRGQNEPPRTWFTDLGPEHGKKMLGRLAGQNLPSPKAGMTSMDLDPLTPYLLEKKEIRVIAPYALPLETIYSTTQQTESTYSLMMHISQSLGVNCTHCHNSRSFAVWDQSPPARTTAWYGIRMVRDLNTNYMVPLTDRFPADARGPTGDVAKVSCATCHQGVNKPLYGQSLYKAHPELGPQIGTIKAAASTPQAPVGNVYGRVLFATGLTALDPKAREVIAGVAKIMRDDPSLKIALSGYADQRGNIDANMTLSRDRAFAVRDALKAAGVGEDRIELRKPEVSVGGLADEARRVDLVGAR